ncbi:MAG: GAK system ATP-grasp enzyme [Deltaproteobacteria bacterium]|nr:GAK system ATP-grasp enzyme [Deltaproteobacteria bacterium]
MTRIGVVGIKGSWSSEKLADAVAEMTGFRLLIGMDEVRLDFDSGRAFFQGCDLTELDALIIKKIGATYSPDLLDRLEILRYLNSRGLPMFSRPGNIIGVLNRLTCTVTLQSAGIPMPPTTITEDVAEALKAVSEYGEAVFKPLYTSKARGMVVIRSGYGTREAIESYRSEHPSMYIQKKIDIPGKDLGVVFLGGEYLTTYARCRVAGSWTTTTFFGGRYEPYDPPPAIIDLAGRAQSCFGLDFTCVDVAETSAGPVVFEVSAFGGFRGLEKAQGIDAAEKYVTYVLARLASWERMPSQPLTSLAGCGQCTR